ncbi:MAG TPA: ribosome small subunit-dependent GTPase A [Longimicrobiales bacterium]|nr:ribosome small subunit-dependent GTPase A [Longimicrobiales bacterium]
MTPAPRVRGVVFGTGGGVYLVRLDGGDMVEASLRGRLKQERRTGDKVVIGDHVEVEPAEDGWAVERVLERQSQLVRHSLGGRLTKVVAANVDRVLAVVATRDPNSSTTLVDRLLVIAESSGVPPVLVVNKVDLEGGRDVADALARVYRPIGYRVLVVSAATGEGMDDVAAEVCRGVSALMGPSGAGKSSLLNSLHPELELRTGALSRKTGRGRHTTVSARLVPLACGGVVADTPGFGEVGVWGVESGEVAHHFPEIAPLESECRFRGCAHLKEPDCAVRAAVEAGSVAESRYRSYVTLREEATAAEE